MRFDFAVPVTPIMEGIINLHNYVMFYLIMILLFVLSLLFYLYWFFHYKFKRTPRGVRYLLYVQKHVKFNHATTLEIIWTLFPTFVLILIAFPSLSLLYAIDEVSIPQLTLKVTGHQWYWSYHISFGDKSNFIKEFDSYLVAERDLKFGQPRLLTTNVPLVLPTNVPIRVLVTADDVLHSWSVPSFGIKVDCVPGRLNQVNLFIERFGLFYGQCSELCGTNHGFMPIEIIAYDFDLPDDVDIETALPTQAEELEAQAIEASVKKWKKALTEVGAWHEKDDDNTKQ
jgi:cytochrome c oxidase subunit 2